MKRSINHMVNLGLVALLVASCGDAGDQNVERTVSGLRNDVSGKHSFEVEVRHGEALPETEARWVLDNLTIVPFTEAFPGAERPPLEALFQDDADLGADGIQVTLRPLDADVAPGDYVWRAPLRTQPEVAEQPSESLDGVGKQESSLILPGEDLFPYEQIYDNRYYCLVYSVSSLFCPFLTNDYGVVCVDQGKLGKAGTTCKQSACNPATIVKSRGWTRAYWRTRIKAGKSGGMVGSHIVTCL